jgi:hypothetical protein
MPIPCSGEIRISQIRAEFVTSNGSLRFLSSLAGFGTPDAMSEFYCYANVTYGFFGNYYYLDPCSGLTNIYYGSNGRWYRSQNGVDFTDMTGSFASAYSYFDNWNFYYVYNNYYFEINTPNPIYWGDLTSYCAPY